MRTLLFAFAIIIFAVSGQAQTKKIAHRSHSGDELSFYWQQTPDNFGETPEMIEEARRRARADSLRLKYVADSIRQRVIADSISRIKKKQKVKKNQTTTGH